MSIIGSSWKEDSPSDDEIERFTEITGEEFSGSSKEFERRIEINKESTYASRKEIRNLSELEDDFNQDFKT